MHDDAPVRSTSTTDTARNSQSPIAAVAADPPACRAKSGCRPVPGLRGLVLLHKEGVPGAVRSQQGQKQLRAVVRPAMRSLRASLAVSAAKYAAKYAAKIAAVSATCGAVGAVTLSAAPHVTLHAALTGCHGVGLWIGWNQTGAAPEV